MPIDPRIRVYRSPIHGYGVIARRNIDEGEVIAEVEGILYREDELEDDRYCLWICDGFYFDMVDQTCWINHSCEPNADIEGDLDGAGSAWAKVVAARAITAGEEITYDYAFPEHLAEPCSCGASSCRGWIVDPDELHEVLARVAREKLAAAKGGQPVAPPSGFAPGSAENAAWAPQSRLRRNSA